MSTKPVTTFNSIAFDLINESPIQTPRKSPENLFSDDQYLWLQSVNASAATVSREHLTALYESMSEDPQDNPHLAPVIAAITAAAKTGFSDLSKLRIEVAKAMNLVRVMSPYEKKTTTTPSNLLRSTSETGNV